MAVFWPYSSYSESIAPYYGSTGNAVTDQSLRWSMGNVLPDPSGLFIDNVIYSYQIEKETGDLVTVYVYNENAEGTGYIFREKDEWKPGSLSGTQINKVVPLGRLHRDLFGDGGIDVEGNGSVVEPNVIYTYKVEPCYDPQFDPNCPGYERPYVEPPKIDYEIYDVVAEGLAEQDKWDPNDDRNKDDEETEEEREERLKEEEEEEKDREERLEEALFEAGRSALFAQAVAAAQQKDMLATAVNMQSYYQANIPGGSYNETMSLKDTQLPENRNGLRNGLAQQLLHEEMIRMQYQK